MPRTSPEARRNATALPVLATVTISAPEKVTGGEVVEAPCTAFSPPALSEARRVSSSSRAVVPTTGAQNAAAATPSPSSPFPSRNGARVNRNTPSRRSVTEHTPAASPTNSRLCAESTCVSTHVTAAACAPSSPTKTYPGRNFSAAGVSARPPSFRGSARRRSRPPSSTRTADASKSSSATCTSTAPHWRPTTSIAPPHARWQRVTARSFADMPALGPGDASAAGTNRPTPSTQTRTAAPSALAAATTFL